MPGIIAICYSPDIIMNVCRGVQIDARRAARAVPTMRIAPLFSVLWICVTSAVAAPTPGSRDEVYAAVIDPPAHSLDVLAPVSDRESGFMADYWSIVRRVFPQAYRADVRARAVDVPSMIGGELVTGVKEAGGKYRLFAFESPIGLGLYVAGVAPHPRPADPRKIRPKLCEAAITSALGERIVKAWREVLLQTRPDPNARPGVDGDMYYFSMATGGRSLSGKTWSPDTPKLRTLTNVTYDIQAFCVKSGGSRRVELENDVSRLLSQLKPDR